MQRDTDGAELPSLAEFWERWDRVLYAAVRNQMQSLGKSVHYDDVMDFVVSQFACRYETMRGNYHPGHRLPFSQYVVGSVKQSVFREITAKPFCEVSQLADDWDCECPASASVSRIDREALNPAQLWLFELLETGLSLREIEDRAETIERGYTYNGLRKLKVSIAATLAEQSQNGN